MRISRPADIGNLVHDKRVELGLTQAELAARVGASRWWVNQLEGGRDGASLGTVLRVLGELGVALETSDAGASPGPRGAPIAAPARRATRPAPDH